MRKAQALSLVVLVLLVVAVGVGGGFAYRTLQDLETEVGQLRGSVAGLQGELAEAEERAADARAQAEAAQARATTAEEVSERLAERAEVAAAEAESARGEAAAESLARLDAEARSRKAALEAARADQEAEEARERLAEERRQRERDLDRLERSLGRIAETRRTALGMVMNLGDSIEFDFDRAELRPANRETLSRIAGVLLTAEGFGIQVYGHTDDVGSADYNLELSERRAEAVRRYLIEAGVDADKIQSKGFGKAAPLVEGTDPAARQRNRRVEIAVVQTTEELPADFVAEGPDEAGEPETPKADRR